MNPTNRFFDPATWSQGSESSGDELLTFNIYLFQHNLDALHTLFNRLTTPGSPEWRHWKSIDEIKSVTAPPALHRAEVRRWLASAGIRGIEDHHDAFRVTAPISRISELLGTTFFDFTHLPSNTVVSRQVGEYTVPNHLHHIIQFITGVTEFPYAARKHIHSRQAIDQQAGKVVPYVIDQLYGIPYADKTKVNQRSSFGVVEYQNDASFNQTDLKYFQQQNLLLQQEVPKSQIVGPYSPSKPDGEATLDIQYAWGVSYNTSAWYWTVEGWLLEWCLEFQKANPRPSVVSMSWGWTETDQCQITSCGSSYEYVTRVNTELEQITMSGVTITASSGDQGAPGDGDTKCRNNQQSLNSIFPGSSPFVLSIGATMLVPSTTTEAHREHYNRVDPTQPIPPICTEFDCADVTTMDEVACSFPDALITTGGGFSDYSPRPSWQDAVVTNYLQTVPPAELPPALDFNATNRGFPDVSALGHNYLIRIAEEWELVDGTSCSAPVWAGFISLWNDFEIKAGRPPLGFINPLIYQLYTSDSTTFFDIVNGNNKCTESKCCEYGYTTAPGWDPVTGLGSPDFAKLYAAIQSASASLFQN